MEKSSLNTFCKDTIITDRYIFFERPSNVWETRITGMAATVSEEAPKHYCKNCKRDIEVNFELHELHCYKNVTLCKKCNEPVAKSEMEEHMETHALVQCKCEEMIEKSQLEKHEEEDCVHRMKQCQFCEMPLKVIELCEHENVCGSRTEPCISCGSYVMIRDTQTHDCSLVKPKHKPVNGYYEYQNGSTEASMYPGSFGVASSFPYNNGFDIGTLMDCSIEGPSDIHSNGHLSPFRSFHSSTRGKASQQPEVIARGGRATNSIISVDLDDDNSPNPHSSDTFSSGASSRNATSRSKPVRSRRTGGQARGGGVDSDNVADNLEDLNISNTRGKRVNGTIGLNKRQSNVERKNARSIAPRSPKYKTTKRADDSSAAGIQRRTVQSDVSQRRGFMQSEELDNDVVADGGRLRNRQRSERFKTTATNSKEWRDVPIKIEDDETTVFTSPIVPTRREPPVIEEQDIPADHNIAVDHNQFLIPCEICAELIDSSCVLQHQDQCLLDQRSALQKFGSVTQDLEPEVVEKIVVDDPNEETFIPCEFCNEAFPKDSICVHQPYCDKNPHRHNPVEYMDVPNTENVFPQGTQRRTFWESRTDMQSNFMHGTYNEHLFDGNESSEMADIINNDSSDSENVDSTFAYRRSHWP